MKRIILASKSPRRKQILQWAEVDFDVIVSDSDEDYPAGLSFESIAIHIARNKAIAVSKKNIHPFPIVAADTIVICNNTVLGKPKDRSEALTMLETLSGDIHQVITGVVIIYEEKVIEFAEVTTVEFHSLDKEQLIYYIDNYKPYDKAGGYAIQEWIGVVGIKSINGDFYNVMGLPVSRVLQHLKNL